MTAFSTDYEFTAGHTKLKLRFVSPLPPDDLELLSMPVCYMEYELQGDAAELSLFVHRAVAYNDIPANGNRNVLGGVMKQDGFESAFLGLSRQMPLSNNGDLIGADWGYFYLTGEKAAFLDETDLAAYLAGGCTAFSCLGQERYIGSINRGQKGAVLLGYDETVSIDYFGSYRKGYYLENHTILEALEYIHHHREAVNARLAAFDEKLIKQAEGLGAAYLNILYASLRQSVAAHKLVRDPEGKVLFLSKECGSNGCIATVDVSYPSMPVFLLYNTELVKGMMRPILKYARMPVWPFDFAPHDVGTYPACCGQVYGLRRLDTLARQGDEETHFPLYLLPAGFEVYDLKYQMPVEECANMLIMFLACFRFDGEIDFFKDNADLAAKWVTYLVDYGLKPENQLCTDDFAGHLKNNINLAIKATVGIAAFAELIAAAGDEAAGARYRNIAEDFAGKIVAFGAEYAHLPLTWDSDDTTFSLKYNLAFDKVLKLGLFPQSVLEREVDCYLQKSRRYGTPLDSREDYTKSDWLMWAARLTEDMEKRKQMIAHLDLFLRESPSRVPFGDWYGTEGGKTIEYGNGVTFRARCVQGGCFMLLL